MKKFAFLAAVLLGSAILFSAFTGCDSDASKSTVKNTAPAKNSDFDPGPGWNLSWSDEFDGDSLDLSKWNVEKDSTGGGNKELQSYTETNVYVENGNLVFLASRIQNVFFSGRINTLDKFTAHYGKIVAKIKAPSGKGMWPGFWMLGTNKSSVNWPRCGEIDIFEMKGGGEGDQIVYGTIHWYDYKHVLYGGTEMLDTPLYQNYHFYELEWDESYIRFKVDGKEYNTIDITPPSMDAFRKPFYIILNLAVGGMFARIYSPGGVTAEFPQYMLVDWVRVYQK